MSAEAGTLAPEPPAAALLRLISIWTSNSRCDVWCGISPRLTRCMSETDANPSPGTGLGRRPESEPPREARCFPGQPVLAGKHNVKYQSIDGQINGGPGPISRP